MNNANVSVIDFGDLRTEYDNFVFEINRRFKLDFKPSNRIIQEAMQAHVLALLNERTHSLFQPVVDDWAECFVDMLFPNQLIDVRQYDNELERNLTYDELLYRIVNFVPAFAVLNREVKEAIKHILNRNDQNFTIWSVELNGSIMAIEAIGDYRIEQWHKDYGVSKLVSKETDEIDLTVLVHHIKRAINYNGLPNKITRKLDKREYLDKLVQAFVSNRIERKNSTYSTLIELLSLVCYGTTTPLALLNTLDTCFDVDYGNTLAHLIKNYSIRYFLITTETIVIHYDNAVGKRHTPTDRRELEKRLAEANMDYVPRKQR